MRHKPVGTRPPRAEPLPRLARVEARGLFVRAINQASLLLHKLVSLVLSRQTHPKTTANLMHISACFVGHLEI